MEKLSNSEILTEYAIATRMPTEEILAMVERFEEQKPLMEPLQIPIISRPEFDTKVEVIRKSSVQPWKKKWKR